VGPSVFFGFFFPPAQWFFFHACSLNLNLHDRKVPCPMKSSALFIFHRDPVLLVLVPFTFQLCVLFVVLKLTRRTRPKPVWYRQPTPPLPFRCLSVFSPSPVPLPEERRLIFPPSSISYSLSYRSCPSAWVCFAFVSWVYPS